MAPTRSSKSHDDEKSSSADSESSASKRRTTRKPAAAKSAPSAPRGRRKSAKGDAAGESAPAAESPAPARDEAPELPFRDEPAPREEFRAEAPPPPPPAERERPARDEADEIPQGNSFSFSPDDDAPAHDAPRGGDEPAAGRVEEPAPSEGGAPNFQVPGASAPQGQPPQGGGGAPGGLPPKRFGKEYWKQLKLEKKRQKLLQRQGQGGGGGGGGGHAGQPQGPGPGNGGGGGGGGGGGHHGARAAHGKHGQHGPHGQRPAHGGRGNRGPQQPPPPEFDQVTGELPQGDKFVDLSALNATAADLSSGGGEPIEIHKLAPLSFGELTAFARSQGVSFDGVPNRHQAMTALLRHAAAQKRPIYDHGWLDLTDRGFGFIVHKHDNYRLYPDDTFLPDSFVRAYGLKRGVELEVQIQPPAEGERCPSVVKVRTVMGDAPEEFQKIVPFEELVPYYPLKRILLENFEGDNQKDVSMRLVDIVTPIGFGQRGLIVAPPRTGKTVILHSLANAISANFPEVLLLILLVDERPEEVTDFKRHTKGEVVSSTFDETPESHVHAAEMVIERARRLIERGQHVVILLDSITRLARAYNTLAANSGKIMSGGIEASALQKPKRFFGSARNIEGGGSLTIIGTALVDTGSKMDEVIFEEFKGTGNMELHLDRDLVNKRIFPAVNIDKSGTRKEELIYHPDELQRIFTLRRTMQGIPPTEAMFMFIDRLKKTKTNVEFLMGLNR